MLESVQSSSSKRGNISSIPAVEPPISSFERKIMLYTIALVLVVLWLLGLVTSYTLGGFIHALLVIAIIVVLVRIISGRSAV